MSRRSFMVNEAMRQKVQELAGVGVPQDDITEIIGCAAKTLRKTFRKELDRGMAEANAAVAGFLYTSAKQGNVIAQIFWLKARAKWREVPERPTPTDDVESNSRAVVVLPDNGRDPELSEVLKKAQQEYFAKKRRGH